MLNRWILLLLTLLVTLSIAVSSVVGKWPQSLRLSLERSFDKPVSIGLIEYRFPLSFVLVDVNILEKEGSRFSGEKLFHADSMKLELSWQSVIDRALVIHQIEFRQADIYARKLSGQWTHPFSGIFKSQLAKAKQSAGAIALSLGALRIDTSEIGSIDFEDCRFFWQDFDIDPKGLGLVVDHFEGKIRHLRFGDVDNKPIIYEARGALIQGNRERAASLDLSGWTYIASGDSDIQLRASGVYLPYYGPYFSAVTPAVVQEGIMDIESAAHVADKDLRITHDARIHSLSISQMNAGDFFGLGQDELLTCLKSLDGQIKMRVTQRWNLSDSKVDLKANIKGSIERSLKRVILANVGHKLHDLDTQNIQYAPEPEKKQTIEDKLKKVKDWFKY